MNNLPLLFDARGEQMQTRKLSHVKVLQGVFLLFTVSKNESVKVCNECASNEKMALGVITQLGLNGWRRTGTQDV
ncbi:hypothetical protein ACN1T8_002233 [Vibrio cholerae]|uniref:hypothetical protein n=1 Tax=Gammaproteobacteria TaxID=1236 RepID=UPI001C92BC5B|nr:hypothetical protein [Vibrio cholerae]MBY4643332.1 hypothetical protein [Vibrio cholerae]MCR9658539.1 hypothetical protein [Vibrio cholerae]MCR9689220.1 hypothetical protein [Vibrio cholerae]MCR9738386.1 hypothetical protein [Vibrio cholerae]MCR9746552.1 hypothetical protein [Vibrio cholerae]